MFLGTVFLFPTSPGTSVGDMNYTVVVLGGVMILSIAWYYCPKYGGVHWFTGPVANIGVDLDMDSEGSSDHEKKLPTFKTKEIET